MGMRKRGFNKLFASLTSSLIGNGSVKISKDAFVSQVDQIEEEREKIESKVKRINSNRNKNPEFVYQVLGIILLHIPVCVQHTESS